VNWATVPGQNREFGAEGFGFGFQPDGYEKGDFKGGKSDGKGWPSWGGESKGWGGKNDGKGWGGKGWSGESKGSGGGWQDGKGAGGKGWNDGKGQAKGWEPGGKGKGNSEEHHKEGYPKWEKKERRPKAGSGDGADVEDHGPLPEGVKLPAAYKGDFRKYGREEFEKICKTTTVDKAKPDHVKAIDSETFPIFLEDPSETFAEKCASAQEEKGAEGL